MTLAEILLSVFYHLSVLSQVFSVLQVTETMLKREIRLETLKWTCLKTLKVDDSFVKTKFSVEKKKKNYNTDSSQSSLDRLSLKVRHNSVKVVC